jgi:hypothetical protein
MIEPPDTTDYFTRYLALYGAIIATFGFGWQLYQRWIRGPKLVIECSGNMVTAGNGQISTQRYVNITVQNRGTEVTTITNVTIAGYKKNLTSRLPFIGKTEMQGIIPTGIHLGNAVPFEIKVGGRFSTLAIQTDEFAKLSNDLFLYVRIHHSFSERASRLWTHKT